MLLDDAQRISTRRLFVPPHLLPTNALLLGLGCDVDDAGWVTTDPTGGTSVWLAGDTVTGRPVARAPVHRLRHHLLARAVTT